MNINDKKECTVKYLGHSAWSVKTKNATLIFDYTKINSVFRDREVLNAVVDIEKLKEENLYVFVSHDHEDHYDKCIFDWSNNVKKIKYIFGFKSQETSNFIEVSPNEDIKVDNIEISTIESTDDGVGFLVKIDGISILHFGDHANWCEETDSFYKEQVDYIAKKCADVDIVFVPIAKGSGARPQSITDGAKYVIEKISPKVLFPMHGGGREYLYKDFAEDIKENEFNSKIVCAERLSNVWGISFEENAVIRNIE